MTNNHSVAAPSCKAVCPQIKHICPPINSRRNDLSLLLRDPQRRKSLTRAAKAEADVVAHNSFAAAERIHCRVRTQRNQRCAASLPCVAECADAEDSIWTDGSFSATHCYGTSAH